MNRKNHIGYMLEELLERYHLISSEMINLELQMSQIKASMSDELATNDKVKYWSWERYQRMTKDLERWTWERYQRMIKDMNGMCEKIDHSVEKWTWERYQRGQLYRNVMIEILKRTQSVNYFRGEKIRVVFLIQVAAFYPSISYLVDLILKDSRFDAKLICYDEDVDPTIKVDTVRDFLSDTGREFIYYKEFDVDRFNPHIVFLQTPYDGNRSDEWKSTMLTAKGYRVIYVPYGIEIADTESARKAHFEGMVVNNAWRVYTFSDLMKSDYELYCRNSRNVRSYGLPRFDLLFHRSNYALNNAIEKMADGRRIVLWKVHFPKVILENGNMVYVTPDLNEYVKFAEELDNIQDYFFVFMPHPRFKEFNTETEVQMKIEQLFSALNNSQNVFIDDSDNYLNTLMNVDYIIIDRSAVMVEAAAVGVPILYMYNDEYDEPLTKGIKPLIGSYYAGSTFEDMIKFIEMCRSGMDEKKAEREAMFEKCIPGFDGKCSERIISDIVTSLNQEAESGKEEQMTKILEKMEYIDQKLDRILNDV